MKFRHFRRYYFDLEYDWDKLDYLLKKHAALAPLIRADLDEFNRFLETLKAESAT